MFESACTKEMLQTKKETKNEAKSRTEIIQHKYLFMKESNKAVLEIWMFKIDEPSGRADLQNRPLLDLADTETSCDSARCKSFTGLNHSSAVILLYWTRHKQVFLQPPASMFLLLASISVSQVWKQMLLILASENLPCVSCQTPQKYVLALSKDQRKTRFMLSDSHLVQSNLKSFSTVLQN